VDRIVNRRSDRCIGEVADHGNIGHKKQYGKQTPTAVVRAHLLQNYLTEAHRDAPGTGCAMGALLGDMTRGSKSARALYTARVKRSLAFFSALLPSSQRSDKRGRALLIGLSEIAGAVGIVLPMAVNIVPSDCICGFHENRERLFGSKDIQFCAALGDQQIGISAVNNHGIHAITPVYRFPISPGGYGTMLHDGDFAACAAQHCTCEIRIQLGSGSGSWGRDDTHLSRLLSPVWMITGSNGRNDFFRSDSVPNVMLPFGQQSRRAASI